MSVFRATVPLQAAVLAANARVLNAAGFEGRLRFSTDTRTLLPGDTFVALRGEHFDGHAYVRAALALGASAVVVSDARRLPAGTPALVVADTTRAYLAFAGVARVESHARYVAVSGSTGKTTTTSLLAQILARTLPGPVLATPGNENNEIGVAHLLLSVPEETACVVAEFGARQYGDLEPLARATRPDVAVLTNIGEAHLEIMGSRERLAKTKWGIFSTGAQPVINAFDETSRALAPSLGRRSMWFAGGAGLGRDVRGDCVTLFDGDGRDELRVAGAGGGAAPARYATRVALPGEHNRANLAAAAAAAVVLGVHPASIAEVIPSLNLPAGRYERVALDDFDLIYDAYNASLSGTLATLASFAREPAVRRIAVLGSMAELGPAASSMHALVGEAAAAGGLATLLVGGDFADDLARGARAGGLTAARIVRFARNEDATRWLRDNARRGDLVLLKASRRYKLEEILEGLRAAHA